VALLAIFLLLAALPFGLRRVWQRHRRKPFALAFSVAAIGFFATLALRLAPAAWETGNRAGEFLFIGLAFVLAMAGLQNWVPLNRPWIGRAALTVAFGIVLVGNSIAGWPWDLQLASPVRASAEGGTISSPPLALGEWARRNTAEDSRFAATTADARMLLSPGERIALAGKHPDIEDLLQEPAISTWEIPLLQKNHIRYVVADARNIAHDSTRGYSFSTADELLNPRSTIIKFSEIPGATRIYSSGEMSVYDLGEQP
jgi:hypothetical protein